MSNALSNDIQGKQKLAKWLFYAWAILGVCIAAWVWLIGAVVTKSHTFSETSPILRLVPAARQSATGEETYSLVWPFLAVAGAMTLLAVAAGFAQRGVWYGALIDDRKRISLSRTQQIAWSILILAALATVTWFHASIGLAPKTELFPSMDLSLWGVLGINVAASPLLSAAIKQIKVEKAEQAAPPPAAPVQPAAPPPGPVQPAAPPPVQPAAKGVSFIQAAVLEENAHSSQASWMDLITGETESTENSLDLSRLQHLMISGMLVTSYGLDLMNALSTMSGGSEILTNMPNPGTAFFGLLSLSHASYLAFQARAQ